MESRIKRIGILTSGGDAPGMNSAIRAAVRACLNRDIVPLGIHHGYNGLIRSDMQELDAFSVNGINARGGTILYTARCEAFKTPEGFQKAIEVCRKNAIDGIIAIGGDGTFAGAAALSKAGVNTVGIPGTIDNDINCTHYSIGFDTAANTAIEAIDKLADTMQSHERTSVVEVMGNKAGHLAVYVGLAVGATTILIPEKEFNFDQDVREQIRDAQFRGKHHHIIIVAEGVGHTQEIADRIRSEMGLETRVTIIGHIQRGGSPSVRDRVMASRMGHYAVERLAQGDTNIVVCYRNSDICTIPIDDALKMHKSLDVYMYRVAQEISI